MRYYLHWSDGTDSSGLRATHSRVGLIDNDPYVAYPWHRIPDSLSPAATGSMMVRLSHWPARSVYRSVAPHNLI